MLQGRPGTTLAGTTVAMVVVLFVVLFSGCAAHSNTTTNPSNGAQTRDLTGRVTDFPTQQKYRDAVPIVAPSAPNVVYKLVPVHGAADQMALARSTDGGATWQTFSVPTLGTYSLSYSAFVSPLNPQEIFLTLGAILDSGYLPGVHPCPANPASSSSLKSYTALSGDAAWCVEEFVSMDDGAHWASPHLPADTLAPALGDTSDMLVSPYLASGPNPWLFNTSTMVFQAQGNRLYSVTNVETGNDLNSESWNLRLVVSTDGGLTWTYADEGLVSDDYPLCDYSAAPSGSVVFALVGSFACGAGRPVSLWRSDDAGAHWAEVGPISGFGEVGMMAVSRSNGQLPLLYVNMEQATDNGSRSSVTLHYSPANVQVSADGGKTWKFAPTSGFPTAPGNALQNPGRPLGALGDGSVLFLARTLQDVDTFYAWKPGEVSWHRVRPDFNTVNSAFLVPGVKNMVCVVTGFNSNYQVHTLNL